MTDTTKRTFKFSAEVEVDGDLNCKSCPFGADYDQVGNKYHCRLFPEIRFDYPPSTHRPHTCRAVEVKPSANFGTVTSTGAVIKNKEYGLPGQVGAKT